MACVSCPSVFLGSLLIFLSFLPRSGCVLVYMISESKGKSINKNIQFVKLLDVGFDLSQFLFVALLSPLEAGGVNEPHVCQFLVFPVDLVPLPLEPFSDLSHLILTEAFPK